VVALDDAGRTGGGEISGHNAHDRAVMGLLRAAADAVIVGAGTLRADPDHLWTAAHIYPPLADAYRALRAALGKPHPPLNVVVTAGGRVDPHLPVFRSDAVRPLVVTTDRGAAHLRAQDPPASLRIASVGDVPRVTARATLAAVAHAQAHDGAANGLALVEGGPHLIADFYAEGLLDEQFLTLAPQVVGRAVPSLRPGLVEGIRLAPEHPAWGDLLSVKRGGSHLFLRYAFPARSQ
jgi:riboflavin biosynthesis pyrimidine reductase